MPTTRLQHGVAWRRRDAGVQIKPSPLDPPSRFITARQITPRRSHNHHNPEPSCASLVFIYTTFDWWMPHLSGVISKGSISECSIWKGFVNGLWKDVVGKPKVFDWFPDTIYVCLYSFFSSHTQKGMSRIRSHPYIPSASTGRSVSI